MPIVRDQTTDQTADQPAVHAPLPSVAHFLPLAVAARRLAERGARMLVVVRAGLIKGLLREEDLLDPSRRSDPDASVGAFVGEHGAPIAWIGGKPRRKSVS
jgi:hypothetical protein